MKKKLTKKFKIIASILVVTILAASVFPIIILIKESAPAESENGKVYITDFAAYGESSDLIMFKTGSTVTVGASNAFDKEKPSEFIFAKAPSLSSSHLYLNVAYSSTAQAVSTLCVIYEGVEDVYKSFITSLPTAQTATIILNVGMKLSEIRIYPSSIAAGENISFEFNIDVVYSKTPILNNEPISSVSDLQPSDGSQSGSGDNGGSQSASEDSSGQGGSVDTGSQSGSENSSGSGSQSGSGGQSASSDPSNPYIIDPFDDGFNEPTGFVFGGNGSSGGSSSGDSGVSGGVSGGGSGVSEPVVEPINYTVVDDSQIEVFARLYNKYSDYFTVGMTAGYQRYDKYYDIEGHFNSFTCENEMKMYTIASDENTNFNYKDPSTYDFSQADVMLEYMRSKGKKIRGHALIWYQEAPKWIANVKDKNTLLDMIDVYCYTVVKHFADKFGDVVYAWDVVNEAVSDSYGGGEQLTDETRAIMGYNQYENGCNQMRSEFYSVAGLDYIEHAFKAARKASSAVKLYYNDYNMCTEQQKLRAVVNMLTKLIKNGTPIDGVGIQSHFKAPNASAAQKARAVIETLVKTGEYMSNPLDIQITELDAENYSNNDTALSSFYGELFKTYRDLSEYISNVTFWGVADDYSWLDHGQYNMAHPFLFDGNQEAKPAFYAVFNF